MIGALANYVAHESKANTKFKYKELLAMAESLQLEEGNPYLITREAFIKTVSVKDFEWNGYGIIISGNGRCVNLIMLVVDLKSKIQ